MLCVRPEHLFAGTQKDTMQDMYAKKRWPVKLTTEQVAQLRLEFNNGRKRATLARKYGISWSMANYIVRNVSRQLQ
jgi:Mor family transcriptional regulator